MYSQWQSGVKGTVTSSISGVSVWAQLQNYESLRWASVVWAVIRIAVIAKCCASKGCVTEPFLLFSEVKYFLLN